MSNGIKQKILSLQGIKVIAFLMIFLGHTSGYLHMNMPDLGARAVELFIFISGFTMIYNHFTDINNGFKEIYLGRFKKYFPVHLITFILMLPYTIVMLCNNFNGLKSIVKYVLTFILNLFLFQSWVPRSDIYFSFNTVSWYLSTMLFCWACSPFIIKLLKKHKIDKKISKLILICIIVLAFKFLYEFLVIWKLNEHYGFFTHIFPLYRVLDYLLGMAVGLFYLKFKKKYKKINITMLQLFSVVVYIFVVIILKNIEYRVVYFPFIMVMIYLLCLDGLVSKALDNCLSRLLSKISLEFFLVHMIVISYWQLLLSNIAINDYLQLIIIFALSILLSYLLKIFTSFLVKKKVIKT